MSPLESMEEFKREMFNKAIANSIGESTLNLYLDQIAKWWIQRTTEELKLERERVREEITEQLFKIEKEKWKDAEHCTCLGYSIIEVAGGEESRGGKEMVKRLQALSDLLKDKEK